MRKIFSLIAAVLFAGSMMADSFKLVTDPTTLADGDEIIIVNVDADQALSTTQQKNNRKAVAVTMEDGTIVPGGDVQIITLVASDSNWKLKVGDGQFLYAPGGGNYLKTADAETAGDKGVWELAMYKEGKSNFISKGGIDQRYMRYNPNVQNSTPLFSCYKESSSVMDSIMIYKNDKPKTQTLSLVPGPWNADDAKFYAATLNTIPENVSSAMDILLLLGKATFTQMVDADGSGVCKGQIPADTKVVVFGRFASNVTSVSGDNIAVLYAQGQLSNRTNILTLDPSMKYVIDALGDPITTGAASPGHWYAEPQRIELELNRARAERIAEAGWRIMFYTVDEAGTELAAPRLGLDIRQENDETFAGTYDESTATPVKINLSEEKSIEMTLEENVVISCASNGAYTYEMSFRGEDGNIYEVKSTIPTEFFRTLESQEEEVFTLTECGTEPLPGNYYIVFNYGLWQIDDDYMLEADPEHEGEYRIQLFMGTTNQFKIVYSENGTDILKWFPDGMGNAYGENGEIAEDGEYMIHFNPNGNVDGWFHGYIFVEPYGDPINPDVIDLDVEYAEASYSESSNEWLINLYKDYDEETKLVTYPDVYLQLKAKSTTGIAGTYLEDEVSYIWFYPEENTEINAVEITNVEIACEGNEGDYTYIVEFMGDDGLNYALNATIYTGAYDYDAYDERSEFVEIILNDCEEDEPGHFYLVGDMTNWGIDPDYQLYVNPANSTEYMIAGVQLTTSNQFKIVWSADDATIENDNWYPTGTGNNYGENGEITEDGTYNIYFNPQGSGDDAWFHGYIYVELLIEPVKDYYEVAEAIAAVGAQEIVDDDVIAVRGIISKIQIKGKNFDKYHSACIYVSDATGAEGEFEFFNCVSLDDAIFASCDPAHDNTSTNWVNLNSLTDANGIVVAVGDEVIAQGKFLLYKNSSTGAIIAYELAQGCKLIKIRDISEGIEDIVATGAAAKVLRDNQILIIKGDKVYNVFGTRVQ